MIVVACNQNIVRAVIIAIPCLIGDLLICSAASPLITQLATTVGYDMSAAGGANITAFLDGGNPFVISSTRYSLVTSRRLSSLLSLLGLCSLLQAHV